ncbi:MAG: penicillin-binding protein, partial [Oscillospiraceae bacterium]|nr:penicillin-binding protein [Oscillospiraceae bacterium]
YLNRALSSAFTPGSVFKLVTAAAALENIPDIEERVFHCDGKLAVGADAVTCPSKHGDIGFEDALAHSCNVAFAQLALELGGDTLAKYAADYGLTQRLPIGNVLTAAGKFEVGADGSIDLAWSGAGQYNDLASPIAMARLCAAIANGGVAPELTATAKSGLFGNAKTQRVMAAETADALREMMGYNVTSYYGADSFPGLELFAKSGTAEVGSSREPHAWFVGFIENGARPLAFAVVVENGGSGRLAAGGVANKVLQAAVKK